MDPTPEMKTVQHKTTMVLLECKLYETLHPETWDWKGICEKSGQVMFPSESIKVVPAASGGGEGEPVAWARLCATANPKEFFWSDIEETYGDSDDPEFDMKDGETVVPLYRAHPQPPARLTREERDAVAGIALVLDRLKLYPEQAGRTKQDDLDLLWRIAEEKVNP